MLNSFIMEGDTTVYINSVNSVLRKCVGKTQEIVGKTKEHMLLNLGKKTLINI